MRETYIYDTKLLIGQIFDALIIMKSDAQWLVRTSFSTYMRLIQMHM